MNLANERERAEGARGLPAVPLSGLRPAPRRTAGGGGRWQALVLALPHSSCACRTTPSGPATPPPNRMLAVLALPAVLGMHLQPEQVVRAQLAALQQNDIARCFELASPANRAATGPLDRFERMVKLTPAYAPLVQCSSFELTSALRLDEKRWRCRVRVRPAGSSAAPFAIASPPLVDYEWMLSLQDDDAGEHAGCWMVDGVVPDRSPPL